MDKIRFLHLADLHLDSPFVGLKKLPSPIFTAIKNSTFTSFEKIIKLAINYKVDFIIIAGDVYDREHRSVKAQARLRKGFEILATHGIAVFISHGNHDHLGGDWLAIEWPENVSFFKEGKVGMLTYQKNERTKVHLYGFSYPQRAVTENKTMEYQKVEGAQYHIGLLHGAVEGNSEHDKYAPFTISQLLEKEYDYWALGHIHQKQILHKDPYIIYPGNIQGLHRGEKGEKGCYLVELYNQDTSIQFLQTDSVRWVSVEMDITKMESFHELLHECEKKKESFRNESISTMLHLKIVGSGPLHERLKDSISVDELVEYLQEGEELEDTFVWVQSVDVETVVEYNLETLVKENGFIGELLRESHTEEDLLEALQPLLTNRKFKKMQEPYTKEELEEILKEAENLLLYQLMKEGS